MKKTYLKPAAGDLLMSCEELMITASGNGEQIVEDGGSTNGTGITEGDARLYRSNAWDDEVEDEF